MVLQRTSFSWSFILDSLLLFQSGFRQFEVSDDVGKIDRSESMGEIDWFSAKVAKDCLLMPERVKVLEGKIDALASSLKDLLQLFRESGRRKEEHPPSDNLGYMTRFILHY